MVSLNLLDNLELKDEKNLLIQGLPSSVEKQFAKLSYAKNVTPLLKAKKVDFVLIFAVNQQQLKNILKDVFQALHDKSKLWIAFPKQTSKITSDLMRENSWNFMADLEYESSTLVPVDHVWNAMKFQKMKHVDAESTEVAKDVEDVEEITVEMIVEEEIIIEEEVEEVVKPSAKKKAIKGETSFNKSIIQFPAELEKGFNSQAKAKALFTALSESQQLEFIHWIQDAKKLETRMRRVDQVIEKLKDGKKRP